MKRSMTAAILALAMSLLAFVACNPTAGIPIELTIAFAGMSERSATTASGWEIELTEARAVIGPVYAYAPLDEDLAFLDVLSPARAFAHGGHDALDGRVVRAELLDPYAVDLLGPRIELAPIDGLEGAISELTIALAPPTGDLAAENGPTRGHHVWIAGVARREEIEIQFEGGLDLQTDDQRIDAIAIDARVTQGASLTIASDARAWLAEADFSGLPSGSVALEDAAQPSRALWIGARNAGHWSATVDGGQP
jgi:hypothetical protein